MSPEVAALGAGIALTVAAQLLLRSGASRGASFLSSFLNPRTTVGYGLFLLTTVLNVFAMRVIDLKTVTAWTALTYVLTPAAAAWVLGEQPSRRTIAGSALVALGILLFSFGS
jgi:drug/metabolite transporter (DMT)-like permease